MRKANTNDLFAIGRLFKKLDLKEDLFKAQKNQEDIEKIGFDFLIDVITKATTEEMQNEIYTVLANPFEMTLNQVGNLEIDQLAKNFNECFNLKTIVNFIKRAGFMD